MAQEKISPNNLEAIIQTAGHIMSQKGYKGTSLQEIADHVGIHKSTVYHYFKSKEDILLAVMERGIFVALENLRRICVDNGLSPIEKCHQAIINHIVEIVNYIDNVNVYHSEIRFLSPKKRKKYMTERKEYEANFTKIIDELKEFDGRNFKGLNSKIITYGILGMCNWTVKWYSKNGALKSEDVAESFYKLIMQQNLYTDHSL